MDNKQKRDFHIGNRKKLCYSLENGDVVILFSANHQSRNANQFYRYRQNSDILYLSGITQEESILLFQKENHELNEYAFIIEPTEHINQWTGVKLTKEYVAEISGIQNIEYLDKFDETADRVISNSQGKIFISFSNNIRRTKYINYRQEEWKLKHQNIDFHDIDPTIANMRMQKEDFEIDSIRKAIKITLDAFDNVVKTITPGIYEYEIEAEFYKQIRKSGCDGLAYLPVISSGKRNCIFQSIDNQGQCHDGDLLLMDVGAEVNGYAADITRTIPVNGKFTSRQKDVYDTIAGIQDQVKQYYVPGSSIDRIQDEFEKLMLEALLRLKLITQKDIDEQESIHKTVKRYSPHPISHFIGLDVHDVGDRHTILKDWMVLSCEPSIYIPDENFGIRIETDILVGTPPVDLSDTNLHKIFHNQ